MESENRTSENLLCFMTLNKSEFQEAMDANLKRFGDLLDRARNGESFKVNWMTSIDHDRSDPFWLLHDELLKPYSHEFLMTMARTLGHVWPFNEKYPCLYKEERKIDYNELLRLYPPKSDSEDFKKIGFFEKFSRNYNKMLEKLEQKRERDLKWYEYYKDTKMILRAEVFPFVMPAYIVYSGYYDWGYSPTHPIEPLKKEVYNMALSLGEKKENLIDRDSVTREGNYYAFDVCSFDLPRILSNLKFVE